MSENWLEMSAMDLGRGIGRGEIDPVALTEAFFDAIEASPVGTRIYARLTRERALAEATAARGRAGIGLRHGPLDGVPISWKDLYDSAGVATESGSRLLEGRVPERDALVLARATRAGLVCLGKTHQTELAFSGLGINPVTATPPNVNDPTAAPGGSSSGAATSVAFGLAAAGIGSDTGGSVRIPAVWNNLVGMKTTHGLLPLEGVVPLCARFDTVGPLTRTVEDAAALVSVMAGSKPWDLTRGSLEGMRFLLAESVVLDGGDDAPIEALAPVLEALGAAGAQISRAPIPEFDAAMPLGPTLFATEAYATWGQQIEEQPDLMHPPVRSRFRAGIEFTGVDFARAWAELEVLRRSYEARVAGFDAVLMPTTPILPPNVEALLADDAAFSAVNIMALRNTRLVNMMGGCALTLPTGTPACGVMLAGPAGADGAILRVGAAVEAAIRP